MINVISKPTKTVTLRMQCQEAESPDDNCGAIIDITEQLSERVNHGWSDFSVDLNCFKSKGMKFGDLVVPFEIATEGTATIQIADVGYEPNMADTASISCK